MLGLVVIYSQKRGLMRKRRGFWFPVSFSRVYERRSRFFLLWSLRIVDGGDSGEFPLEGVDIGADEVAAGSIDCSLRLVKYLRVEHLTIGAVLWV